MSEERGEIVLNERRSAALEQVSAMSPMQELQMQIVRTGDLEKLKQLREIERDWKADQAKQAFNKAFAAFKSEAVKIVRTKLVISGPLKDTKHVELGEVVKATTPALSKYGLSISWRLTRDEKDWMEVTCTLRHEEGHSETVSMGGPPDVGPGRNAIQARGSSKTYLERYTATAILGLAPESDTDGVGVKPAEVSRMDESFAADFIASIEGAGTVEELQTRYFEARDAAAAAKDGASASDFEKAKDKRYRQLVPATGKVAPRVK